MEVSTSFVADAESYGLVKPGEGALDYPADLARSGAVGGTASGDHGFDAVFHRRRRYLSKS